MLYVKDGKWRVHVECISCDYVLDREISESQAEDLQEGTKHIQNIFPYMSPGDREMFITGMCNSCFPSF